MNKRVLLGMIVSVVGFLWMLASPAASQDQEVLRISGATTIQPIIERMAKGYTARTGRRVDIRGGGSRTGVMDAVQGESHLGMVSRALSPMEKEQLRYVTIGLDALAIIVNARNPLQAIDKSTVIALFTGRILNWSALTAWDREVVLVSKEMGRSTLELFENYSGVHHPDNPEAGPNGRIPEQAYEIASNLDGATLVGGIPGAVGYMSLGTSLFLQELGMPIKILALEGLTPCEAVVRDKSYPIIRELNLVYLPSVEPVVRDFLAYALGPEGRQAVMDLDYIALDTEEERP